MYETLSDVLLACSDVPHTLSRTIKVYWCTNTFRRTIIVQQYTKLSRSYHQRTYIYHIYTFRRTLWGSNVPNTFWRTLGEQECSKHFQWHPLGNRNKTIILRGTIRGQQFTTLRVIPSEAPMYQTLPVSDGTIHPRSITERTIRGQRWGPTNYLRLRGPW